MNRDDKQKIIEAWHERFAKAQSVLLTKFQGLNAAGMYDLRTRCREAGLDYVVLKNTLARIALKNTSFEALGDNLVGPVGWAVGYADETEAAKVISKYAKDSKIFEIIGGGIVGRKMSAAEVEILAKLPGRNEMRATFLSVLNAVPSKFVRTLNEVPAGMVRVLAAKQAAMEEN